MRLTGLNYLNKSFLCRSGNMTVRMKMKINMQMTSTCPVRTLTPRGASLSEICVSEKIQLK